MGEDLATWFNQNLLTGKIRFPDYKNDWETIMLKDLVDCTNSKKELRHVDEMDTGKYPIYTSQGLYKKIPVYDMEVDYIGLNLHGSPGKSILAHKGSSMNSTHAYLTIKEEANIDLIWLFLQLQNIHWNKYIQGSTIKSIKWKDFNKEKILVPCIKEQEHILGFFNAFKRRTELIEQQIHLMKLFKKGLLQQLFV